MKKMKTVFGVIAILLVFAMALSACQTPAPAPPPAESTPAAETPKEDPPDNSGDAEPEAPKLVEITIPHYRVGENVGAKFFLPQVERFNEKYAGIYKMNVEEVPQDNYADKIKQLGQQNALPALIEGGVDEIWLNEDLIPNNKFYDLNQFLDNDPELKARLIPTHLNHNNKDGKLFSINYPIVRPTVLYYNEALYQPSKDIGSMSWDELIADLGDNKIAFMTAENAWTTMIAFSSMVATQPGGPDYMISHVPDSNKIMDFTDPLYLNGIIQLQKVLQAVAYKNTVGAAYADAANTFMSNNAAIICNGSWMIGDFNPDDEESVSKWSNGFDGSKVRAAALPGNVGLDSDTYGGYGMWIPANVSQEEAECAWAYIAFMMSAEEIELHMLAEGGSSPTTPPSADYLAQLSENKLLAEYVGAITSKTTVVPYISSCQPGSIADPEFGKLLPKLIDGSLTPEQFCAELTTKAAETAR